MSKDQFITLKELAEKTGSELVGNNNYYVSGVNELSSASSLDVTFFNNAKYKQLLSVTQAGAICIDRFTEILPNKNFFISNNPLLTFQKIIDILSKNEEISGFHGIDNTAIIHRTAKIGNNVSIGPYTVIDKGVVIGDNCTIFSHVTIGVNVIIGKDCIFYPNSVIRNKCKIGDRVIVESGAVIGGCGFGYTTDENGEHHKITHLGNVILEDDVEIGANTTIDIAKFKSTVIGKGTKIDNLVMIAHNAQIGENNLFVSQVGVAGSTKTGRNVVLGGQAGLADNVELTDCVIITARGGVSKSICKKGVYGGSPALAVKDWHKNTIHLKNLSNYVTRIKELEKKINLLEKVASNY